MSKNVPGLAVVGRLVVGLGLGVVCPPPVPGVVVLVAVHTPHAFLQFSFIQMGLLSHSPLWAHGPHLSSGHTLLHPACAKRQ